MKRALLPILVSALLLPAAVEARDKLAPYTGRALVWDGDTVMMSLTKLRLAGIDAPEPEQACSQPDGSPWPCGAEAGLALEALIDGRDITCQPTGRTSYNRPVVRCRVGALDLNGWMVEQGWAVLDERYEQTYAPQQARAKAARRGVWVGTFQLPCHFRGSC